MPIIDPPYGCQRYNINRLCRFDRRAIDRKCDGCPRTTDRAYLESQGLWVIGVSHALPVIQAESSLFVGNAEVSGEPKRSVGESA